MRRPTRLRPRRTPATTRTKSQHRRLRPDGTGGGVSQITRFGGRPRRRGPLDALQGRQRASAPRRPRNSGRHPRSFGPPSAQRQSSPTTGFGLRKGRPGGTMGSSNDTRALGLLREGESRQDATETLRGRGNAPLPAGPATSLLRRAGKPSQRLDAASATTGWRADRHLFGGSGQTRPDEPKPAPSSDDERAARPGRTAARQPFGATARPNTRAPVGPRLSGHGTAARDVPAPRRKPSSEAAHLSAATVSRDQRTGRSESGGVKTHGSLEQRFSGNAESLATDSLADQGPEVDGAAKANWKLVATPEQGKWKPSPTTRGNGNAVTRGRLSGREKL